MATRELSPREEEIVELCVEGLTNDAIAHRLGVSVGTVNTYWLRIKLKIGGTSRTDAVARVLRNRAEKALFEVNADQAGIEAIIQAGMDRLIHEREEEAFERRAMLALLQ